jgi:hypothetical protein
LRKSSSAASQILNRFSELQPHGFSDRVAASRFVT